mgnify:CR=1 FL=1
MTQNDLLKLIDSPKCGDPVLLHNASVRLAKNDPELLSLLWLLREGVIGRHHFQNLLAGAIYH